MKTITNYWKSPSIFPSLKFEWLPVSATALLTTHSNSSENCQERAAFSSMKTSREVKKKLDHSSKVKPLFDSRESPNAGKRRKILRAIDFRLLHFLYSANFCCFWFLFFRSLSFLFFSFDYLAAAAGFGRDNRLDHQELQWIGFQHIDRQLRLRRGMRRGGLRCGFWLPVPPHGVSSTSQALGLCCSVLRWPFHSCRRGTNHLLTIAILCISVFFLSFF